MRLTSFPECHITYKSLSFSAASADILNTDPLSVILNIGTQATKGTLQVSQGFGSPLPKVVRLRQTGHDSFCSFSLVIFLTPHS
jgi:hypothetical protein